MTFPTVAVSQSFGSINSDTSTSFDVPKPSGIVAGSRWRICLATFTADHTITDPTGATFVEITAGTERFSSVGRFSVWERECDGSEPSTVNIAVSVANQFAGVSERIENHDPATPTEIAYSVSGNTAAPDPPSLNPAGWGTEDTLWSTMVAHRNDGQLATTQPSGFGAPVDYQPGSIGTFGCGVVVSHLASNAASIDPAAWTLPASVFTGVATLGVKGAPLIAITVDADNKSKTYGSADPALTASVTSGSLRTDDYVDADISRAAGEDVDVYAITLDDVVIRDIDDVDVTALYAVTETGGTFTINHYPIEVTADEDGKTYGASDPSPLGWQTTDGVLQGDDTFTGTIARAAGEEADTYAINIGTLAIDDGNGGGNYTITFVPAYFVIAPRAITITAANKSKLVDASDPPLTASVTSGALQFDDALSGALTRAAGETAGTYAITQGTLTVTSDPHAGNAANYTITFVPGVLTISLPAVGDGSSGLTMGLHIGL